jgi:hypothetical protein
VLSPLQAHLRGLASSQDPIQAGAARELLAELRRQPRTPHTAQDRAPAPWHTVIEQVIGRGKTGHAHAHSSKSGTCVSVNAERGVWYCSSCRSGGTTVTWIMEREELRAGEAWQYLVDQFGAEHA